MDVFYTFTFYKLFWINWTKELHIYNYYFVIIKGKEDENERESTENAVLSLTKTFSQHIQSRETLNQSRRRASETTVNTVNKINIPSLTDKETKKTLKGERFILSVDRADFGSM